MNAEDMLKVRSGIVVDVTRVIMKRGTYPPCWKKHHNT